MPYRLDSFGISDIGRVRQNNEDVWAEIPDLHFYVLADGMGGHKAGEVAAKEAVTNLCQSVETFFASEKQPSREEVSLFLKKAISDANRWVYDLSKQDENLQGMGTTLCCCLFWQDELIYAHVGDSRLYRFRGQLEQLTKDHSLKRELISRFQLSEERASALPFKNVLTRAVGTSSQVEPDIAWTSVLPQDIYILCSDGLTDALRDQEIAYILYKNPSLKNASEELVEQAKINGSTDNITLVMMKIL